VREYARIQTFPDSYIFEGGMGNQYKQIGNAVPVNLANAMAKQIKEFLS
jgi:DNA (cytosine-5)-methyltransferase 1